MPGLLLDTHAFYWLVTRERALAESTRIVVGRNQETGTLFVSPMTAWELAVATQKSGRDGRPDLGGGPPDRWFRAAVRVTSARIVPIQQRIAFEAARVAADTGHRDPGDCFLIATVRIRGIPIVTRDGTMRSIAAQDPDYLTVIEC